MKTALPALMMSAFALAAAASPAPTQTADGHKITTPGEIQWKPAPASLPPGAEVAVLYGDPAKEGLFAMRLKVPKGYHVPPHMHPKPEVVTVISGTFRLGMGEMADQSKARALSAGSFFAMLPGMAHYVYADEDTVVQLNTNGPWGLTYVNPKDDPRQKTQ